MYIDGVMWVCIRVCVWRGCVPGGLWGGCVPGGLCERLDKNSRSLWDPVVADL